jgi:hypothetical protein
MIMKRLSILSLAMLAVAPLLAADSTPKDAVTAAAAALGNQPNYSWRTTVEAGNGGRFRPGPTDGKIEKGGYAVLTLSFNDNTTDVVIRGTNAAVKTADAGWRSAGEVAQDGNGGGPNPARMAVYTARSFKAPAEQAATLAGQVKELTTGTNGVVGDLTEEGAKALLMFRRGGSGDGPTASGAKGTVTFWLADGKLVKYQTHVTGTVSFNGNDRDVDRTTTTEIKDVGTTKVEVADDSKKKLE